MRILLVSCGIDNKDGWSRYTETLQSEFQKNGYDVHMTHFSSPISFLTNPFIACFSAIKLRRTIQNLHPDIIHFTVEPLAMMLPFLGKSIAKKSVLTIHGSYGIRIFQGFFNKRRARWIMKHIGKIITVSNYTKKRTGMDDAVVIPNGVSLPDQYDAPANKTKHVLCIGGVKPRKGILESLDALAIYKKEYDTDIDFIVVGSHKEDAYYQEVQNKIYGQRLSDTVTFTGIVDDETLKTLYQSADVYLMPAKTTHDTFEGFGLVYIEAASYGIPCIGTNDSGAAEAIDEGVSGFKVNPNDAKSIAKNMDAILNEQAIKREHCRAWAEKHTAKIMAEKTSALYDSLKK